MSKKKRLDIKIEPFGPTQQDLDRACDELLKKGPMADRLRNCKYAMISMSAIDSAQGNDADDEPLPLDRYRAEFYDYSNEVAIICQGRLGGAGEYDIRERKYQPLPSQAEFAAAVAQIKASPEFGPAIKEGLLTPYAPMPPLVTASTTDDDAPRTVAVGLATKAQHLNRARQAGVGHEIVAVQMSSGQITRFTKAAPALARAAASPCGAPMDATQPTTVRGTTGQAWITVNKDGVELWRFLAVRPAASSGTRGSGVELRSVHYRGKKVLRRAHVPILNVKYDNDACGPFRDWQFQEGLIHADGNELAPGILQCTGPAKTIFDTGSDTGNYLGVGVYEENGDTVLVSEMEAGWYRYLSLWRLTEAGIIKPRFGFAAVQNSCVCERHHHHAYWRFDFDIVGAQFNQVYEHNVPPVAGSTDPWRALNFEVRRARNPARQRHWRVENTQTREAYLILPGPNDGVAKLSPDWPFPRGDVWILRNQGNLEFDDGVDRTGPPCEAELDRFVTGESISNKNVVMWYAGHFTHDLAHDDPATHGHILGPDLVPQNWG